MNQENRNHFLVDINKVFSFLGTRYFVIFYFGRHLHPRQQQQLVNQRRGANWAVILLIFLVLAGCTYGLVELIAYRLTMG